MDLRIILICVLFFVITSNGKLEQLKICVVARTRPSHSTKYCDLLEKSKQSPVSCIYFGDRLECLKSVSRREADFTLLQAEDLYFSTLWQESAILVVSEIRAVNKNNFEYGGVVVVRNSLNITTVEDLKDSNLCHPGLNEGPDSSTLFAQYFEERVKPQNCDSDLTIYEDRIKTTSEFFKAACKAGPWVADQLEDRRLKEKYSNLCDLCDSGCGKNEKYTGGGGSITCLKDGVGDVLWARYDDVRIHFKLSMSPDADAVSEYSFLCEDGTTKPLYTQDPCFWLARPWQVVAANRKSATDVQKILDQLKGYDRNTWKEHLVHLIESFPEYIQNLVVSKIPEDYLRNIPGYLSASAMTESNCKPKPILKFCTSSQTEQRKCIWISKAAIAFNVQPSLECVEKSTIEECLESVSKKDSDFVVVRPDYQYIASVKYGLIDLLYEAPKQHNETYLLSAVVKKSSNIKKLSDLNSKRACFTRSKGFGWNGAFATLKGENWISSCSGKKGLLEFFQQVCVMKKNESEDLPSCCENLESTDDEEKDAFRCLASNGCDVAFISLNTLYKNTDGNGFDSWSKSLRSSDYKTICRNDKSSGCYWYWSYPGNVMILPNPNSTKMKEAYEVLLRFGQYFGKKTKIRDPMLQIFGSFIHAYNHADYRPVQAHNVLFQDSSIDFVEFDHWNQPNDYKAVLDQFSFCSSSYATLNRSLFIVMLTSAYLLVS